MQKIFKAWKPFDTEKGRMGEGAHGSVGEKPGIDVSGYRRIGEKKSETGKRGNHAFSVTG